MGEKLIEIENQFSQALSRLFKYNPLKDSVEYYTEILKTLVDSSKRICAEKDFLPEILQDIATVESEHGVTIGLQEDPSFENDAKWIECDSNPFKFTIIYGKGPYCTYRILRVLMQLVRYLSSRTAGKLCNLNFEEKNIICLMQAYGADFENAAKCLGMPAVDALKIGCRLFNDFLETFLQVVNDLMSDCSIYAIDKYAPLQYSLLGYEFVATVNWVKENNQRKPLSQNLSDWYRTLLLVPTSFLKYNYLINNEGVFDKSESYVAKADEIFQGFDEMMKKFKPGDEFEIMRYFLYKLGLKNFFSIEPVNKSKSYMN